MTSKYSHFSAYLSEENRTEGGGVVLNMPKITLKQIFNP